MAVRAQILVVDDDHGFRAFARAMLERDGFTVTEAATSAAPAEAARAVQPRTQMDSRWRDGWQTRATHR